MASDRLSRDVERLRDRGYVLPKNPIRAAQTANGAMNMARQAQSDLRDMDANQLRSRLTTLGRPLTDNDYQRLSQLQSHNKAMMTEMRLARTANRRLGGVSTGTNSMGADAVAAMPRFYDPLEYWDLSGLPWNMEDEGHRHKLHKWLRLYYSTHYLIPTLIDIFTRFPLIGMELEHPDPELRDQYEEVFFNQLKYPEFFVNLGREVWTVGEAFPLGSFNEHLGVWEREELINPEDVVIEDFALLGTKNFKIVPPDYLKRLAQQRDPAREFRMLEINFPELIPYLRKGQHIPVSNTLLRQVASKNNDWDEHGTPILLRALRTLLHEEKLLASQDAIAERLYSPLILAKLGPVELGDNLPPFLPGPDELEAIRDDFDLALSSDFRLIVHHAGLEVENVFGREQMPRLGDDFDRIERRLMQVFGVNPSLLSAGSNAQPYASSALQAEFLNQILKTYQNQLVEHYKERAYVMAEALGHQAYEKKGQTRVPLFEEVIVYDEDGDMHIEERPKYTIPEMKFASLDLRDEQTQRQFLMNLRQMGVPVPDEKLMVGIDWKPEDMIHQMNVELKNKTIEQQQAKMDTYTALKIKGLPIPFDLKAEVESVLQPGGQAAPMGGPPGMGGPGGGMGGPPMGGGGMPMGGPGMGGPMGGPGGIMMPGPPPGMLGPGRGNMMTIPGGGAPPIAPFSPGPPGSVPQISNERRPGLTYNTAVEHNSGASDASESASMSGPDTETTESSDPAEWKLARNQQLLESDEDKGLPQRILEKKKLKNVVSSEVERTGKKYSIVDPYAPPLEDKEESESEQREQSPRSREGS